jgi:DNA processing protein
MRVESDLAGWLDLSLAPGVTATRLRALLSAFGLPGQVLACTRAQLERIVPPEVASSIRAGGREAAVQEALEWASADGHWILTLADAAYPQQLLQISDPPPVLYVRGDPARLSAQCLAVVGSRNATAQGESNAENFSRALSDAGLAIVSGLAMGIDAAAHRGGLAGASSSVAVIGTGADIDYPRQNARLAAQLEERGAIVSEYALGTPPAAHNFPRRNRLIAGLSRGCLVVEAALGSGSLTTARMAADQGREVYAIPGSIHSPLSRGCHALIRNGAKLVETAQDVMEELGMATARTAPDRSPAKPNVSPPEHKLLLHVGYDPCDVATIAHRAGLTPQAVSAMLLQLELEGKVAVLPGGRYQRTERSP